jgi:hypothetical protein
MNMKSCAMLCSFLLFPLALAAMTPVPDAVLSGVTCQAGVSIDMDLTMDIHAEVVAWGDSDGINPSCGVNPWPEEDANRAGYIGVADLDVKGLRIRQRESDGYGGYTTAMARPLTIDVATGYKPFSGYGENTTYVRIAPGSQHISMESMEFAVVLGPSPESLSQGGQVLGTANIGATQAYVNPRSTVDTYAHGKSGVAFDLNVVLDGFKMGYASWGDTR